MTIEDAVSTHPLSALSPGEMARASSLARIDGGRFVSLALREPNKAAYLAWREGRENKPPREALAVLVDEARQLRERVIDLDRDAIASDSVIEGAFPPITGDEYEAACAAAVADQGFVAALARYGVTDMSLVQIDVLAAGAFDHPHELEHRIARCVPYLQDDRTMPGYAKPIESMYAFLDLDELRVLSVEEIDRKPIPDADGDYRAGVVPPREALQPIEITQPSGVSFELEGNEIRWHRWSFRATLDPQEGLVLHDVRFDERPVLHRASCPEMIVPYGEPHPMHSWRTYFDAGEYGLGSCTNSLSMGCDCVGEIRYLDAHMVRADGSVREIQNAICLHEEDSGLLWKHTHVESGHVEVRRGRRFVVNSMATVGNYDYAFRWNFNLDGSIEVEVQLHGIVSTMAVAPGEKLAAANMIDRGLAAPHHQHLFCFRLDLDVDGTENSVKEVEAERLPIGRDNPIGNAFRSRITPLRRESEARRDADDSAARSWTVTSTKTRNGLGGETGYRLVPLHGTSTLMAQPGSSVDRRAGYSRHSLWVTPYDERERHPASTYPYQMRDTNGLPQWSSQDRSVEHADVVLWYVAGSTHFVRPEEWPIMPVAKVGFLLEPSGFFDRNPTLDIPPAARCHREKGV